MENLSVNFKPLSLQEMEENNGGWFLAAVGVAWAIYTTYDFVKGKVYEAGEKKGYQDGQSYKEFMDNPQGPLISC